MSYVAKLLALLHTLGLRPSVFRVDAFGLNTSFVSGVCAALLGSVAHHLLFVRSRAASLVLGTALADGYWLVCACLERLAGFHCLGPGARFGLQQHQCNNSKVQSNNVDFAMLNDIISHATR